MLYCKTKSFWMLNLPCQDGCHHLRLQNELLKWPQSVQQATYCYKMLIFFFPNECFLQNICAHQIIAFDLYSTRKTSFAANQLKNGQSFLYSWFHIERHFKLFASISVFAKTNSFNILHLKFLIFECFL